MPRETSKNRKERKEEKSTTANIGRARKIASPFLRKRKNIFVAYGQAEQPQHVGDLFLRIPVKDALDLFPYLFGGIFLCVHSGLSFVIRILYTESVSTRSHHEQVFLSPAFSAGSV